MDFKRKFSYLLNNKNELFSVAFYIWLTYYVYHIHDYLFEFKLTFQWIMCILWLIFTFIMISHRFVSELTLFGNKIILKDVEERLRNIENTNNNNSDMLILQNRAIINSNNDYGIKENNNDTSEYNINYIYSYKVIFELYLANIYMMLKKNQKMESQSSMNFVKIINKIRELNIIDKEIYNTLFKIEIILNKKSEDIEENDYNFLEEKGYYMFKELENIEIKINNLE